MSKKFGKVRRTSKPNLEPPEPSVCHQKPNLEPTEPQNTEPNLEPHQVRPNTNCVSMCKPLPYLDETFYILVHFHLQYIFLHLQCIVGTIANRIPIVSKVVCDN